MISRRSFDEVTARLGGGTPALDLCEIVSDLEAEAADLVVCSAATMPLDYPDNLTGACADCGMWLQWRPHAPKLPPKLCMGCTMARAEKSR
jgi:hypothetical protein